MASEIESRGLIFELQWKKKPGLPNKEEDIASLGIWDTADPSLDWCTFKSYLSQNLGTPEHISVAYVDSEGDELPIESECEFQEALKFARERSRKGRKIILKVDKQPCPDQPTVARTDKKRSLKYKHARGIKLTDKFNHSFDFVQPKLVGLPDKCSAEDNLKSIKDLEDLQKYNKILMEKLERMSKLEEEHRKLEEERRKKYKTEKDDLPPPWFKKYMQKMKHEIVTEVTANTRQLMGNMMASNGPYRSAEKNGGGYVATKVKRRSSDEESSDAALGSDQRDHKLLRKIEKLHKREKKLEKKLDSKLERLENKTKRMMEKKSQSRAGGAPERRSTTRKRSGGDGPVGTYLMDAILLDDAVSPRADTRIRLGRRFTKIWEIMNNGTLPWTDKTELRLAWGTLGLEPEEPSVKCPILEPGEKGQIAVNFRAPDFSGTFESYWHFYHMGERFGHWIGCAVVVEEPNKSDKSDVSSSDQKPNGVIKKTKVKCEKPDEERPELLDNIASSTKECPPNEVKRFNDAANSHHVHNNIEVETPAEPERISNLPPNNNNNINEPPARREAGGVKVLHGGEYESDSDSDNLSVISGPAGRSSESDDDDNFVVVPMPACFACDTPLGAEGAPIVVKDNSGKVIMTLAGKPSQEDQKAPDKPARAEENTPVDEPPRVKTTYPFGSFEVKEDGPPTASGFFTFSATAESNAEEERTTETSASHSSTDRWWDSEDRKSDVYAVDSQGSCVPLADAWPADGSVKIPLGFEPGRQQEKKLKQFHTTSSHSHSHSFSQSGGSHKTPATTNVFNFATAPVNANPNGQSQSAAVHILPETIVNGAINVATSAFSTARAVLGNLRVRAPTDVVDGQCAGARSTSENMKLLSEMGFINVTQNVLLLQRFNNDIGKVVAELLNKQSQ